jgi:hypothetical protein
LSDFRFPAEHGDHSVGADVKPRGQFRRETISAATAATAAGLGLAEEFAAIDQPENGEAAGERFEE